VLVMSRVDSASRVIASSAPEVFAALIEPEALVRWLPPGGMSATFERFDMRPGGSYRMVLRYPDQSDEAGKADDGTDIVEARIVELVPGERVVQAVDFESDDPRFHGTMTMTWCVAEAAGGSDVRFVAEDVPEGISAGD